MNRWQGKMVEKLKDGKIEMVYGRGYGNGIAQSMGYASFSKISIICAAVTIFGVWGKSSSGMSPS